MARNNNAPANEDRGAVSASNCGPIVSAIAAGFGCRAGAGALGTYLDQFTRRVLLDALNEATGSYWMERARQLDAARPQPGDFNGRACPDAVAARDSRLRAAAQACRARAQVAHLAEWEV